MRIPRGSEVNRRLAAQAKLLDQVKISLGVFVGNVLKQTAAAANHLKQATAGCEVVLIDLKVLSQFLDALGQNANLDSCRTGVVLAFLQVSDNRLFLLTTNHVSGIISDDPCRCKVLGFGRYRPLTRNELSLVFGP